MISYGPGVGAKTSQLSKATSKIISHHNLKYIRIRPSETQIQNSKYKTQNSTLKTQNSKFKFPPLTKIVFNFFYYKKQNFNKRGARPCVCRPRTVRAATPTPAVADVCTGCNAQVLNKHVKHYTRRGFCI